MEINALEFVLSYLTNREQSTRINGHYSLFQMILSGVPQGSTLGPIVFNIFLNDIFLFITRSDLHNYADDNKLSSFSNSIPNLLEGESEQALAWLHENKMIANPDKCQCIIINKDRIENTSSKLIRIGDKNIYSEDTVKLL